MITNNRHQSAAHLGGSYSSSDEYHTTASGSSSSGFNHIQDTDTTTTDEDGNSSDLSQLVYTSSATNRYVPFTDLTSILKGSRERNAKDDITGLLLYRDGSFAQFLEGPSSAVQATFERIAKDSRHRGVIVVLNRDVKKRDFPDWRMGYRDLDFDLQKRNVDEDKGQVGGVQVDDVASSVFDLTNHSAKE